MTHKKPYNVTLRPSQNTIHTLQLYEQRVCHQSEITRVEKKKFKDLSLFIRHRTSSNENILITIVHKGQKKIIISVKQKVYSINEN